MTIDLGFASATLPSGQEVGFVDVPGHARFVKNMLAGVGATDACLFVVAATEGWRAQSEEHLRILELLGMRCGMVALTKVGLVDEERRDAVAQEVIDRVEGTFLEGTPIVAVDVRSGIGTVGDDGLVASLDAMVAATPTALDVGRPRLWVDRSFVIRGSGTVVTGSLTGGTLAVRDRLVLEPGGTAVRVRGLQGHGRDLPMAGPGRRLAANLVGVGHKDVDRGAALVRPGDWHRATVVDASLKVLEAIGREITRRGAYFAYLGSGEYPVRLRIVGGDRAIGPGGRGAVRMWLPVPLPLVPGDRYVLREAGRQETVGGGEVLDVAPQRPTARARPSRSVDRVVGERGWVDADELRRLTGETVTPTLEHWVVSPVVLEQARSDLTRRIAEAGRGGLDLAEMDERQRSVAPTLEGTLVADGRIRLTSQIGEDDGGRLQEHPYLTALQQSPFSPPEPHGVDRADLRALQRNGSVVERDGVWFATSAVDDATRIIAELLSEQPEGLSVSTIRVALGTSRKYVMPLLALLDATGATRRQGAVRTAGRRLPGLANPDAVRVANHTDPGDQ